HYYPFQDEGEWELGKFLVENLTQAQITKFFEIEMGKYNHLSCRHKSDCQQFNNHARPSFTTKDKLLDWMDLL
ncbi:hypothetical protein BDR06DRAFT_871945, partial [Suillus hirtellus]